jgi:uncharacterized protein
VIVKRPDAEELLAIRAGAWAYDQLLEEVERLDHIANDVYEASTLRHHPDDELLNDLCVELVEAYISANG